MKNIWVLPCIALLAASPMARCQETHTNGNNTAVVAKKISTTEAVVSATSIATAVKAPYKISSEQKHPTKASGVPNFGKLNDAIWRSGQPTRAGYKLLASQGVKTVVNLRSEFPQDKDLMPQGVNYIYIPITDEHAPTLEQAQEFMRVASDPNNWPLLVHCHAGEGRAGTMAALVRCTLDKWSDVAVMKETEGFRGSHFLGIKQPMASSQRKFIMQWENQLATPGSELSAVASGSKAGTTAAVADGK